MGPAPLVLASRSPQRRAILEQVGIAHVVRPSRAEEHEGPPAATTAAANARAKALAVAAPGELVLGVDTMVTLDGRIFGKPAGEGEARAHLRALGGRIHEVVSGLALVRDGELREAVAVTRVAFRELDDRLVDWFVETGEWRDRAGGYAIQGRGAALVRAIDGDYLNVVGLPLGALLELEPGLAGGSAGDSS